jgi:hypothetical protein
LKDDASEYLDTERLTTLVYVPVALQHRSHADQRQ